MESLRLQIDAVGIQLLKLRDDGRL
jgi:hypothetical protein